MKGYSCVLFLFLSTLLACEKESTLLNITLTLTRLSDAQNLLTWNPIENVTSYKIWRSVKLEGGAKQDPELLASVDFLTLEYLDSQLPLSNEIEYYVSTTSAGRELKSRIVQALGATALYILPYQMELIPEKKLAVIRGYTEIYLLDYEKKIIVGSRTFPGKVGMFDMATHAGKKELYVPCSDNNIYICDAYNLDKLETIVTNAPVTSVAVNSQGWIFSSGQDFDSPLKLYDRETLGFVSKYSGEVNSGLGLNSDTELISISTSIEPPDLSVYKFDNSGNLQSKMIDPYNYGYEMDGTRMKVNETYVVTSTRGSVYSTTNGITYIGSISNSSNQTDFEFSEDGKSIYSAGANQRRIIKSTIAGGNLELSYLSTKAFPWIIARDGSMLIVLSSPNEFTPYTLTGKIVLEKIKLN